MPDQESIFANAGSDTLPASTISTHTGPSALSKPCCSSSGSPRLFRALVAELLTSTRALSDISIHSWPSFSSASRPGGPAKMRMPSLYRADRRIMLEDDSNAIRRDRCQFRTVSFERNGGQPADHVMGVGGVQRCPGGRTVPLQLTSNPGQNCFPSRRFRPPLFSGALPRRQPQGDQTDDHTRYHARKKPKPPKRSIHPCMGSVRLEVQLHYPLAAGFAF